jgi:hypothetical protein
MFRKKKRLHLFGHGVTSRTHNCDDEGDTFLRNVVKQLPNNRVLTIQKVWFLNMKTGLQLTQTSRAVSFTVGNAPGLPNDLLYWKPAAVLLSTQARISMAVLSPAFLAGESFSYIDAAANHSTFPLSHIRTHTLHAARQGKELPSSLTYHEMGYSNWIKHKERIFGGRGGYSFLYFYYWKEVTSSILGVCWRNTSHTRQIPTASWIYTTYHFFSAAKDTQLPKPNVEWRAREASIRLFYNHHINGPCQSGCIDFVVEVSEVAKDFTNVAHAIHHSQVSVKILCLKYYCLIFQ